MEEGINQAYFDDAFERRNQMYKFNFKDDILFKKWYMDFWGITELEDIDETKINTMRQQKGNEVSVLSIDEIINQWYDVKDFWGNGLKKWLKENKYCIVPKTIKSNEVSDEEIKRISEEVYPTDESNTYRSIGSSMNQAVFIKGFKAALNYHSTTSEPIKDEELYDGFINIQIPVVINDEGDSEEINLEELIGNDGINACIKVAKQYAASKTKDLQKDLDLAISEIVKLQMNQITQ